MKLLLDNTTVRLMIVVVKNEMNIGTTKFQLTMTAFRWTSMV